MSQYGGGLNSVCQDALQSQGTLVPSGQEGSIANLKVNTSQFVKRVNIDMSTGSGSFTLEREGHMVERIYLQAQLPGIFNMVTDNENNKFMLVSDKQPTTDDHEIRPRDFSNLALVTGAEVDGKDTFMGLYDSSFDANSVKELADDSSHIPYWSANIGHIIWGMRIELSAGNAHYIRSDGMNNMVLNQMLRNCGWSTDRHADAWERLTIQQKQERSRRRCCIQVPLRCVFDLYPLHTGKMFYHELNYRLTNELQKNYRGAIVNFGGSSWDGQQSLKARDLVSTFSDELAAGGTLLERTFAFSTKMHSNQLPTTSNWTTATVKLADGPAVAACTDITLNHLTATHASNVCKRSIECKWSLLDQSEEEAHAKSDLSSVVFDPIVVDYKAFTSSDSATEYTLKIDGAGDYAALAFCVISLDTGDVGFPCSGEYRDAYGHTAHFSGIANLEFTYANKRNCESSDQGIKSSHIQGYEHNAMHVIEFTDVAALISNQVTHSLPKSSRVNKFEVKVTLNFSSTAADHGIADGTNRYAVAALALRTQIHDYTRGTLCERMAQLEQSRPSDQ